MMMSSMQQLIVLIELYSYEEIVDRQALSLIISKTKERNNPKNKTKRAPFPFIKKTKKRNEKQRERNCFEIVVFVQYVHELTHRDHRKKAENLK